MQRKDGLMQMVVKEGTRARRELSLLKLTMRNKKMPTPLAVKGGAKVRESMVKLGRK